MIQGNKVMRKGISLVEMLTAIILFGLISVISYNYYKNYYDTTFAGKQTRVYAIIDQATQISNAYDLYSSKMGSVPTTIQDIVNQRILTKIPDSQIEITNNGWDLNATLDTNGTGGSDNGIGFTYILDNVNLTAQDQVSYCEILNNAAKNTYDLNKTATTDFNATVFDAYADVNNTMFCFIPQDTNNSVFVFLKADEN